jgi:hypothetical protein
MPLLVYLDSKKSSCAAPVAGWLERADGEGSRIRQLCQHVTVAYGTRRLSPGVNEL